MHCHTFKRTFGGLNFSNPRRVKCNTYCNSSAGTEEIIIPKRINRGSTDILQALASVTKKDPTAAHYKYHDDPFLIPVSNFTKRMYALSQESGRKTAMWILQQHPELFQHRVAEPPIEAFFPKATYDDTDEVDLQVLQKVVDSALIEDSITVYKLLQKKGEEIPEKSKQSLLEMLCFFNETEDLAEQLIEERWFMQAAKGKNRLKKTWKDGGFAEKLFESMAPTPEAYSAIIQGMAKYYQVERAWNFFNEAKDKGFPLSVNAYNHMLKIITFLRDGHDQRWKLTEEILRSMNEQGLKPDLGTLNSVLEMLSMTLGAKDFRKYALKMIAEAKRFGIEPSLASYHYLLLLFCNEKSPPTTILENILDKLEGNELTIRDKNDVEFFSTAMERCRYVLQDKDLAYRVNDLLFFGRNYNLIGDSFKESVYYRNFFLLLCQTEGLDELLKQYRYLVPNIYTPEPSVMEEIIKTVNMNGTIEHYPWLWSHVQMFNQQDRDGVMIALINGMSLNRVPHSSPPSENAVQLANIAWSIFRKVEDTVDLNVNKIVWTGIMLGDIMTLLLCGDDIEKAAEVLKKMDKDQREIMGLCEIQPLTLFMDVCVQKLDVENAMLCLRFCVDAGFGEVDQLAEIMLKKMNIGPMQKTRIAAMVGSHVLKTAQEDAKIEWKSV